MKSRIKSLASDTMIYGIFTIFGRFITFLLTPLYTNYLSLKEVGEITYLFSIIAFFNIIFSFGFDSAYFRFFKNGEDEHNRKVFSHSYIGISSLALFFTVGIILFSGSFYTRVTNLQNGQLIIILSILIPFLDSMMTIPYSELRMKRNARKFSFMRFGLIIITVALNVLFMIVFKWGGAGVLLAQVIANLIGVLLFLPVIFRNLTFKIDKSFLKEMMKFGLPTVPAMISGMILQVADRPLMKMLGTQADLSIYSVNYRLGIPMMLLVSVFEYAWKPFYLNHYQDEDAKDLFSRVLTYFTVICAFLFLATSFYMEYLVKMPFVGGRFINPVYWSGMGIIPVILAGYYFNGVFNNFAAGFQIEKQTKYLPLAVGSGAIANVIINLFAIPMFGIWGAAWATFFAYLISAAILYFYSLKIYPINYNWSKLIKIWLITGFLFFAIKQTGSIIHNYQYFLVLNLGLVLFFALLMITKVVSKKELSRILSQSRKSK